MRGKVRHLPCANHGGQGGEQCRADGTERRLPWGVICLSLACRILRHAWPCRPRRSSTPPRPLWGGPEAKRKALLSASGAQPSLGTTRPLGRERQGHTQPWGMVVQLEGGAMQLRDGGHQAE